jgi:hypothetical protein
MYRKTLSLDHCSPECRQTTPNGWPHGSPRSSADRIFTQSDTGGYSRMISEHVGKRITEEQRARWVQMLYQSAEDASCQMIQNSARRSPLI